MTENALTSLFTLLFQANEVSEKGNIAVSKVRVADEFGVEQDADVRRIEVSVIFDADVSGDGTFSLGDVAIVAAHYLKTESGWKNPKADINKDDNVDNADLGITIEKMLQK